MAPEPRPWTARPATNWAMVWASPAITSPAAKAATATR